MTRRWLTCGSHPKSDTEVTVRSVLRLKLIEKNRRCRSYSHSQATDARIGERLQMYVFSFHDRRFRTYSVSLIHTVQRSLREHFLVYFAGSILWKLPVHTLPVGAILRSLRAQSLAVAERVAGHQRCRLICNSYQQCWGVYIKIGLQPMKEVEGHWNSTSPLDLLFSHNPMFVVVTKPSPAYT